MTAPDPFDLERFVTAQDAVWTSVVAELAAGRKRSHWMWFVFPQLAALGRSPIARRYGIEDRDEALAFLEHPLLGPRLGEVTRLVLDIEGHDLRAIFGTPDDLKFRSSMTLFAESGIESGGDEGSDDAGVAELCRRALRRHCGGEGDPLTLDALR